MAAGPEYEADHTRQLKSVMPQMRRREFIAVLGGTAPTGVGFDQFLLGFRQYSARPLFDWGHLVFHIDRDQPIGPAIDGERNLLGRELPADLMLDRHAAPCHAGAQEQACKCLHYTICKVPRWAVSCVVASTTIASAPVWL
jgi:hypothetical protein